jgi:transposase InsO family protein
VTVAKGKLWAKSDSHDARNECHKRGQGSTPWLAGQGEQVNRKVQFTAQAFTGRLEAAGVALSMDGRGWCLDNVFVERLWRRVKHADVYLRGYATVPDLQRGLGSYLRFYNHERLHQALDYQTPAAMYQAGRATKA